MSNIELRHKPVMCKEVLSILNPSEGCVYLDGTLGAGGHSRKILESADCRVIGIDKDPTAIELCRDLEKQYGNKFLSINGSFGNLSQHLNSIGINKIDGILLDLGTSSMQLRTPERGFSFRSEGPLDMRMSKSGQTAADVVMHAKESQLATILWKYGEEKAARRIAKAICRARNASNIVSTRQLAKIICDVMPPKKPGQIDPATRSFQALRIFVNQELDELVAGLEAVEKLLRPGGILAIVSFHSLEDRIVKRFLTARSQHATRPSRHLPYQKKIMPTFYLPQRKAVLPLAKERDKNIRARSAKLRIACRTPAPVTTLSGSLQSSGTKDGYESSSSEAKLCV